jgi:precorrin-2/cobalt-factor-2 C20-methyltransferase
MSPDDLGTLYGVGVGPGDPGMVTMRAVEIIRSVPVIAFPVQKEGASSRALDTVKSYVPAGSRLLPLVMPMTRDAGVLAAAHEQAAAALTDAARDGGDVAYLSLGDPLFYSTFGYLAERFPGEVKVISGVTAPSAASAALSRPIASKDTPTVFVTGADQEALEAAAHMGAAIVIMKPRALSPRSIEFLEKGGLLERASAAIEIGGRDERILAKVDRETAANLPYFSVLLIGAPLQKQEF